MRLNDPVAGEAVTPNFLWGEVVAADSQVASDAAWAALQINVVAQGNARLFAEYVLQPIRDALGGRLKVTSWYRTPEHNIEVGGAPKSLHLVGAAVDVVPLDHSLDDLETAIAAHGLRSRLDEVLRYEDGHMHLGMAADFTVGYRHVRRLSGVTVVTGHGTGEEPSATVTAVGLVLAVGGTALYVLAKRR